MRLLITMPLTIENQAVASSPSFETLETSHSLPPVKRQLLRPTLQGPAVDKHTIIV